MHGGRGGHGVGAHTGMGDGKGNGTKGPAVAKGATAVSGTMANGPAAEIIWWGDSILQARKAAVSEHRERGGKIQPFK